MPKLKLGKMASKELADWFGVAYGTYNNTRRKRLTELQDYAEFEVFKGGVYVKEILIDTYQTKEFKDNEYYIVELTDSNDNISTVAGMVRSMIAKNVMPEDVSIQAMQKRLLNARNRLFDKPKKKEPGQPREWSNGGTCGKSKYVWAVKVSEENKYRFMTKEEEDKVHNIIAEYYNPKAILEAALDGTPEEGQSQEDFEKEEKEKKPIKKLNFFTVLKRIKEDVGIQLVKATKHMVLTSLQVAQQKREDTVAFSEKN